MQCGQDVENGGKAQKTGTKSCIHTWEKNMNKKVISELEQGLNFVMMVEVWFFDDFFKKHKGKKGHFHRFSLTWHGHQWVKVGRK